MTSLILWGVLVLAPLPCAAQNAPAPPAAPGPGGAQLPQVPAYEAQPRADQNSMLAHAQLLEKKTRGRIDIYFEGDSIVRRWGATDYPQFLANWNENFHGWNAADFGWGADRTQNILWRLQNGELDGINPKVIVLLAGTNNVGTRPGDDAKVEEITRGLRAILDLMRAKAPAATIVLTAIFPRNDNIAVDDQRHQSQSRGDGQWIDGSIREHQRPARRCRWQPGGRRAERRQAPSVSQGLSDLGRCAEAPLHRDPRASSRDGQRATADRRSQRRRTAPRGARDRQPARNSHAAVAIGAPEVAGPRESAT